MHLFHSLTVVAFVAFTALATLPPTFPNGKYLGGAGGSTKAPKFFFRYIPVDEGRLPATEAELGTLAYLAGQEVLARTLYSSPLESGNKPWTVSVWQDKKGNIWMASSDGNNNIKTGAGHAEQNIVDASNKEIDGGWSVAYTWGGGDNLGLRTACHLCKPVLESHNAVDLVAAKKLGWQPDPPPLPDGWTANWRPTSISYEYESYDGKTKQREIPTTRREPPKLPVGWDAVWDKAKGSYYYKADGLEDQWTVPDRTPFPPSNQEGAEAAGWGSGSGACRRRRAKRSQSGLIVGRRQATPGYTNSTLSTDVNRLPPPPSSPPPTYANSSSVTDQDLPPIPADNTPLVIIPLPILVNYTSSWPPLDTNQTKASRSPVKIRWQDQGITHDEAHGRVQGRTRAKTYLRRMRIDGRAVLGP